MSLNSEEIDPNLMEMGFFVACPREETVPILVSRGLTPLEAHASLDRWREAIPLSIFIPQSWMLH